QIALDPGLPEFRLPREAVYRWWKTIEDVDRAALEQVQALRSHPLIPDEVRITAYVYEVESGRLRRPGEIYSARTARAFYR
ncbi:MAG: carbonic anhydrase, partial [Bryobacteraceae bacterium]